MRTVNSARGELVWHLICLAQTCHILTRSLTITKPLQLSTYHDKLLALRARLDAHAPFLGDDASHDGGSELADGDSESTDRGNYQTDVAVTISLATRDAVTRKEIQDALDRISARTFGNCEKCHAVIGARRLNTIPYARYCVECERRVEQEDLH
jgi:DnaK suppressor protein